MRNATCYMLLLRLRLLLTQAVNAIPFSCCCPVPHVFLLLK